MNMVILHIAGHGKKKSGVFDPGATGFIKQGEHKYYAETFFDLLKKYEPKGHKVIYHTAYNVYNYGNIVDLAKSYGQDTVVIEWHFDAALSKSIKGGHVIVYNKFKPDALDLRLRDGINKMVGVRYNHQGHKGIAGRSNLGNANRCAKGKVNYRLIELGLCTNCEDSKVMLESADEYAKVMSEAIYNQEIKINTQPDIQTGDYIVKSGDTLWGIANKYNMTVNELKKLNGLTNDIIHAGNKLKLNNNTKVESEVKPIIKPEPKKEDKLKATKTGDIVIRSIQSTLNSRYNTGLRVDGYYGVLTRRAIVKGLQTELNKQFGKKLQIDGSFGSSSRANWVTVKRGAKGNLTYLIQALLYCKGYKITLDLSFGGATKKVVKQFQKDNKLTVDGKIGKNTITALVK